MLALNQFIANLEQVPWFKHLGGPAIRDPEVFRIYDWQTWPGPEDPGATIQAQYHIQWREDLFQAEPLPADDPLITLWTQIHDTVFDLARASVPYHDGQDAWYGPNAAVWQACWAAALVGCRLFKHGRLPEPEQSLSQWTLAYEWSWFQEGHWPCCYFWSWGYTDLDAVERTDSPRKLIVY